MLATYFYQHFPPRILGKMGHQNLLYTLHILQHRKFFPTLEVKQVAINMIYSLFEKNLKENQHTCFA